MRRTSKYSFMAILAVSCACGDSGSPVQQQDAGATLAQTDAEIVEVKVEIPVRPSDLEGCPSGEVKELGNIELMSSNPDEARLTELSGIAASRTQRIVWVHDDSGNEPNVYALSAGNQGIPDGTPLAIFKLVGVAVRDWEDMAMGPGTEPGVDYLYLGDIGDKNRERLGANIVVYRFPEPQVIIPAVALGAPTTLPQAVEASIADFESLYANYPEGLVDNADALFVDALGGTTPDVYVITSGNGITTPNRLFRMSTKSPTEIVTMEFVTSLFGGPAGDPEVTGADMSPDGQLVIVRTLHTAAVWTRSDSAPMEQVFAGRPCSAIIPIGDSESGEGGAIGFTSRSDGYYTTIEGDPAPLWLVPMSRP